jgi:flagellar hook-basal body complex protein FliE
MTAISSVGLTQQIQAAAQQKLASPQKSGNDFGDQMQQALYQVAAAQSQSSRAAQAFETGEETDVTKVMLARERASLAFEATLQIRNKLLSAYKDIVSMPV